MFEPDDEDPTQDAARAAARRPSERVVAAPAPSCGWALFLDIDGTLLDIAATPDTVEVPATLIPDLTRIARRLDGALALVSGRRVADSDRILGAAAITIAGQHGGELRRTGDETIRRVSGLDALTPEARDHVARAASRWPGVIIEEKELGVAVHYRLAPSARDALGRAVADVAAVSGSGLRVIDGDRVWELVPAGFDKGTAIEALMSAPPFAGRKPVFVGDDVTDEDAFVATLRLGGIALRVGDRRSEHSIAPRTFADASEVRAWLAAFAASKTEAGG
jgi:trehalose 6-phosphate phosphatase